MIVDIPFRELFCIWGVKSLHRLMNSTWDTFSRAQVRRGRRSHVLVVDPAKTVEVKLASKRSEVKKCEFVQQLIQNIRSFSGKRATRLVSYGIGSIYESPISQYQYATLLEIMEAGFGNSGVGCYDPVLSPTEYERMHLDAVERISFPYSLNMFEDESVCVFYMPHCESQTYTELLADILLNTRLKNFLLFGSDLLAYNSDTLKEVLGSFQVEKPVFLTQFEPRADVFNDCHIQIITRR